MSRPNEIFVYPHNRGGQYGLTKREYFAGLAMQGLLAHPSDTFCDEQGIEPETTEEAYANGARLAVAYADALIAALNAEQQP